MTILLFQNIFAKRKVSLLFGVSKTKQNKKLHSVTKIIKRDITLIVMSPKMLCRKQCKFLSEEIKVNVKI